MPTTMQLAARKIAGNKDIGVVMIRMCGMPEIKLNTLDLWTKLQTYYFILTEEERKEVDALGGWAERLDVTPKAYKEGLPVLKNLGFIQCLGGTRERLLRAGEVIDLMGQAAAAEQGWMESIAA